MSHRSFPSVLSPLSVLLPAYTLPLPYSCNPLREHCKKMQFRRTILILLNQTNEELIIDKVEPGSTHCFVRQASERQESILAGEYEAWVVISTRPVNRLSGSLRYSFSGTHPEDRGTIAWSAAVLGRVACDGSTAPDGYQVDFLGGRGFHSVMVLILSTYKQNVTDLLVMRKIRAKGCTMINLAHVRLWILLERNGVTCPQ